MGCASRGGDSAESDERASASAVASGDNQEGRGCELPLAPRAQGDSQAS